jgi:probable addiction module antidote protein
MPEKDGGITMPKRTKDYREELLKSLLDPEAAANYINAALEDSEEMLLVALRDVAEAHQMSTVATAAGISRESIYRMLSETGNPRLSSLAGILKAVGLRLMIEPNTPVTVSIDTGKGATSERAEATTVTAKNVYLDISEISCPASNSTVTVTNQSGFFFTSGVFHLETELTSERTDSVQQPLAA